MRHSGMVLICLLALGCEQTSQGATTSPDPSGVSATQPPAGSSHSPAVAPQTGLTEQELAAQAPAQARIAPTITLDQANGLKIKFITESGYTNQAGKVVVDMLEQDYVYLALQLTDQDDRPVAGAAPELAIQGQSRIMPMTEAEAGTLTDGSGRYEFAVIGGPMNVDRLSVTVGDARAELLLNIISLDAAGYPSPDSVEGALPWAELASARIEYLDDGSLQAEFPPDIAKWHGQRVKLAGFMLPLEAEQKQKHFLLTSNPPSCFFHIPGGPTGAVEVISEQGIKVDWDLLILEGRLETIRNSDIGVVYMLHDARVAAAD